MKYAICGLADIKTNSVGDIAIVDRVDAFIDGVSQLLMRDDVPLYRVIDLVGYHYGDLVTFDDRPPVIVPLDPPKIVVYGNNYKILSARSDYEGGPDDE